MKKWTSFSIVLIFFGALSLPGVSMIYIFSYISQTHPPFECSKLIIETLEKRVKYVQS